MFPALIKWYISILALQDENWRLKQYIDLLITRAIGICPEVLCVDNSSHA